MATFLVTGITGTVMPPLAALLLERGHTVVALVRPRVGDVKKRIVLALGIDKTVAARLFVINGDITKSLAGVAPQDQKQWRDKIEKVIHGAASTKFAETPAQEIKKTNVRGTQEMLRLAGVLEIPEFHHISTAYVCGPAELFREREIGCLPRNDYEASKIEAEALVRGFCGKISMYRIPIVVGDSRDGHMSSFSGYYGVLEPFWRLFQVVQKKWKADHLECKKSGLWVDEQGYAHVPLALPCSNTGPVNMVPRDWLAATLADLAEIPAQGRTLHLAHPSPFGIKFTLSTSIECVGVKGIRYGEQPQEGQPELLTRLQRGVLRRISQYVPYIGKGREHFDTSVLRATLCEHGKQYTPPPPIDADFLAKLAAFAKAQNFGRT